jgi:uncharacterized protein DUF6714
MSDLESLRLVAAEAIKQAFPVGTPPTADEMRNDHCPECAEVAARFSGKLWPEVSVADLKGNPGTGLLPVGGWRYYLPALMLRCVEAADELDCVPDSVVWALSPAGGKPHGRDVERLAAFPAGQIAAILAFLRWLEACEKAQWSTPDWPQEAVDAVPVRRPLKRALRFWTERAAA